MEIASALAGFSPDQANLLRKDLGKKVFQDVASRKSCSLTVRERMELTKSLLSKYSNSSLYVLVVMLFAESMTSYALKDYESRILKANYPEEFRAGQLKVRKEI